MNKKVRWSICDDAEYVRFTYIEGLKKFDDLEFIGATSSAGECIGFCKANNPDVLLLDIQLEEETAGLEAIEKIKDVCPDIKIIVLTSFKDEEYIFKAFAGGADSYVLKDDPIKNTYKSMIDAYNSSGTVSAEIAQLLAKKTRDIQTGQKSILRALEIMTHLSASEFEVLKGVYAGKSYKEIAKERFVDLSTIKVQASRVIRKFGATSMAELIPILKELKIFDLFD